MALLLTGALALSAVAAVPARADVVHHLIPKGTIQAFCKTNNGTYWPTSSGGTYGCFWDESVVVCGGVNPDQKGSCYEPSEPPHKGPIPPWVRDRDKASAPR